MLWSRCCVNLAFQRPCNTCIRAGTVINVYKFNDDVIKNNPTDTHALTQFLHNYDCMRQTADQLNSYLPIIIFSSKSMIILLNRAICNCYWRYFGIGELGQNTRLKLANSFFKMILIYFHLIIHHTIITFS